MTTGLLCFLAVGFICGPALSKLRLSRIGDSSTGDLRVSTATDMGSGSDTVERKEEVGRRDKEIDRERDREREREREKREREREEEREREGGGGGGGREKGKKKEKGEDIS